MLLNLKYGVSLDDEMRRSVNYNRTEEMPECAIENYAADVHAYIVVWKSVNNVSYDWYIAMAHVMNNWVIVVHV